MSSANPTMHTPSASKFWDKIAKKYAARPIADEAAYRQKLEITREYMRPDMEVMEFGCGTGSTALLHAPYVKHILATDISEKMIEIAQSKAAAQGVGNVTFRRASVEELDMAEDSLDMVMGHSILHLVEDRDAVIAQVFQRLKPGGVFVTSTACVADFMPLFRFVVPVGRLLGLLPVVKVFSAEALRQSLTGAGFRIERDWQPGKSKAVFIVAVKPE